jgi:hypothetical protein
MNILEHKLTTAAALGDNVVVCLREGAAHHFSGLHVIAPSEEDQWRSWLGTNAWDNIAEGFYHPRAYVSLRRAWSAVGSTFLDAIEGALRRPLVISYLRAERGRAPAGRRDLILSNGALAILTDGDPAYIVTCFFPVHSYWAWGSFKPLVRTALKQLWRHTTSTGANRQRRHPRKTDAFPVEQGTMHSAVEFVTRASWGFDSDGFWAGPEATATALDANTPLGPLGRIAKRFEYPDGAS